MGVTQPYNGTKHTLSNLPCRFASIYGNAATRASLLLATSGKKWERYSINLETLIRYKAWADSLLYESLCKVPEQEFEKDRPMLFGNILALLNHVYAMDVVWKCNLQCIDHNMETRNPKEVPSFKALRQNQNEINSWYEDYTAQLATDQLSKEVIFTFIGGSEGKMKTRDVLQHVVNHASYHRGHIEGVLYQMSIEPPTTDIPVFLTADNA